MTAFLGYVLPYGQMSLWGATVITNLMSAIPWVGQDIVELKKTELPTIGTINRYALKKGKKERINKSGFITIPYSFLALLVGLIDGNGYFLIHKTSKGYIKINLTISFNIRDLSILQHIKSIMNIGEITTYPKVKKPDTCKFIINKTDLQEVFFPLLFYHKIFFLTHTRRNQFDKVIYILEKDKKIYSEIPKNVPTVFKLPKTASGYLSLPFFKNWIVGFTIAEGSFLVKANKDACFQLKQKTHILLFDAFKLIFDSNHKIGVDNNIYNLFSVCSKSDIQKVINFFSFSGNQPLLGHQYIRYIQWLTYLRNSERYCGLNYP